MSNRSIKKYFKERRVSYLGKTVLKDLTVDKPSEVKLIYPAIKKDYIIENYLLSETEDLLFFYKPPFMHSERVNPDDELCLSDIVSENFPDYHPISRLDFETDGIIAAMRRDVALYFQEKRYYAWVNGIINENFSFDKKVDASKRKKVKILSEKGDNILNFYVKKQSFGKTLLEISLNFAHRHQIRSILGYLGTPIVGDKLYGKGDWNRMLLQCYYTKINSYECILDNKKLIEREIF
ncbi:MAG: hypothetical protein LDL10_01950 [Calditerrivibrio sp.]|nr:hypothetical protein [Calditerrivibrio sp.]